VNNAGGAIVDAWGVSNRIDQGEIDPQRKSAVVAKAFLDDANDGSVKNVAFSDLVDQFIRQWLAGRSGGKETNT
jgi:hypothetical protein